MTKGKRGWYMNRYEDYLDEVMRWEVEIRSALKAENVHEDEGVYIRLNDFTEKIARLKEQGANEEVIAGLQMEVESLHQETEQYFKSRRSREAYVKPGKHLSTTLTICI